MNPLSLYLVRHGRTVYNTQNRVQGWCDSPLTTEGRRSVRVTAEHLRGRAFAAAYSSPSGRTMETAREILALHPGTPLTSDGDLREFGFGEFEAGPEAQLFAQIDAPTLFDGIFDGRFPACRAASGRIAILSAWRRRSSASRAGTTTGRRCSSSATA